MVIRSNERSELLLSRSVPELNSNRYLIVYFYYFRRELNPHCDAVQIVKLSINVLIFKGCFSDEGRSEQNCFKSNIALLHINLIICYIMLVDIDISAPKKERKFWLSDYIYENRQSDGKKSLTSKYGMARRMPRVNKRHEILLEDTLKVIAKAGETSQIVVNFQ